VPGCPRGKPRHPQGARKLNWRTSDGETWTAPARRTQHRTHALTVQSRSVLCRTCSEGSGVHAPAHWQAKGKSPLRLWGGISNGRVSRVWIALRGSEPVVADGRRRRAPAPCDKLKLDMNPGPCESCETALIKRPGGRLRQRTHAGSVYDKRTHPPPARRPPPWS